jgi:hypothetical protein
LNLRRCISTGLHLAAWIACAISLASPAAAQSQPVFAPCLTAHADATGYQSAFLAAGWTQLKSPAERTAAARTFGETIYMMSVFPPEPTDAASLDAMLDEARAFGENRFANDRMFRRGTTLATFYMIDFQDPMSVGCQFADQSLPEVEAAVVNMPFIAARRDLKLADVPAFALPGIENANVTVLRYLPQFTPTTPMTGQDAIFVSLSLSAAP